MITPERLEQEAAHVEVDDVSAAGWLRAAARRITELEAEGAWFRSATQRAHEELENGCYWPAELILFEALSVERGA